MRYNLNIDGNSEENISMILKPAYPVLKDMIGARIEYIHAEPYQQQPVITMGTIQSIKELKDGRLEMLVKPDAPYLLSKYRIAEIHLISYIHTPINSAKKAIA
jgi:hypothetical protein